MRFVLVAKPWKGGLARYLFLALRQLFDTEVKWITTYPVNVRERMRYAMDRQGWREQLVRRIACERATAIICVNHLEQFRELPARDNQLLWVTDAPRLTAQDVVPYGRVFLSDPGYETELSAVLDASRYGGPLPFAHLPAIHYPHATQQMKAGACFIGSRDPGRDDYLARLLEADFRFVVVGNHFLRDRLYWRRPFVFRPRVAAERMGDIYARHAVSVNLHAQVVRRGTNMRTFEAAGYGIAQIVDHRHELERYFEPGREIDIVHNPGQMVERVAHLLREPAIALRLARNARLRAMTEHTYWHRLVHLLRDVVSPAVLNERLATVTHAPGYRRLLRQDP